MTAKTRIWPWLSYMCHVRSTASSEEATASLEWVPLDRCINFLSANPSYIESSYTREIIITIQLVPASECLIKS